MLSEANFVVNMRTVRRYRDLSQMELAAAIGHPGAGGNVVAKIERRGRTVALDDAIKIAAVLGYTVEELSRTPDSFDIVLRSVVET